MPIRFQATSQAHLQQELLKHFLTKESVQNRHAFPG